MKTNQRIALIAVAAIAAAGAWSAREDRRPPCANGVCRLPLLPADNKWTTATPPSAIAPTNATPPHTTSESGIKP
jgi:hypothetical protein